jgi:hypothetical protein
VTVVGNPLFKLLILCAALFASATSVSAEQKIQLELRGSFNRTEVEIVGSRELIENGRLRSLENENIETDAIDLRALSEEN